MGKWSDHTQGLPHLPLEDEEEPDKQARIDAAIDEYLKAHDVTLDSIAREYRDVRNPRDLLKKQLKEAQFKVEVIESIIRSNFEAAGVSNLSFTCTVADCDCGGRGHMVITSPEPIAQINKEDAESKEKFRQWCVKYGLAKSMHLHYNTLQSLIKDILEAGKAIPPGLKLFNRTKVQLRKK